ncbi:MAG TPA: trypsin-like serine protease [Streptosporangiaceae bacterium]|nr:trypsin-like serine protease [Streptosporangiaceae bacterium]
MPRREPRERTGRRGGVGAKVAGVAVFAALIVTAMTPAAHGAARVAVRFAAAMRSIPRQVSPGAMVVPVGTPNGTPFTGTATVGALFTTTSSGALGTHFCTASVVRSPHQDLAVTAAHCMQNVSGVVDFVPGYRQGSAPYGIWPVSKVVVDQAWSSSASINDDVAFLVIRTPRRGVSLQSVTGAEQVGFGQLGRLPVQVIGYPDSQDQPLICHGRTSVPLPRQLKFDCGRYTAGTSGGPFLMDVAAGSGTGTVVGVIGGYQQGGDLPQISYAAEFGPNVAQLYRTAVGES